MSCIACTLPLFCSDAGLIERWEAGKQRGWELGWRLGMRPKNMVNVTSMPPQFPGVLPPDLPAEDMWFVEPWAEEAHAIQQMGDAGGDEVDEAADPEPDTAAAAEETPIGAGSARWAAHGVLLLLCCIPYANRNCGPCINPQFKLALKLELRGMQIEKPCTTLVSALACLTC
jgi:hypothetical protein